MTVRHSYDRNSLCCLTKWSKTCCLTSRSHFGRQAQVNTRFLSNPVKIYVRLYELLIYFHVNYTDMFSKQIYWIDILPRNMRARDLKNVEFLLNHFIKIVSHQPPADQMSASTFLAIMISWWKVTLFKSLSSLLSSPEKRHVNFPNRRSPSRPTLSLIIQKFKIALEIELEQSEHFPTYWSVFNSVNWSLKM